MIAKSGYENKSSLNESIRKLDSFFGLLEHQRFCYHGVLKPYIFVGYTSWVYVGVLYLMHFKAVIFG